MAPICLQVNGSEDQSRGIGPTGSDRTDRDGRLCEQTIGVSVCGALAEDCSLMLIYAGAVALLGELTESDCFLCFVCFVRCPHNNREIIYVDLASPWDAVADWLERLAGIAESTGSSLPPLRRLLHSNLFGIIIIIMMVI